MAQTTDGQIKSKYEANTQGFALLSKTRQELAAQIPQSADSGALTQNPSVQAIKQAIEELDSIKKQKESVMNDGVSQIDQMNANAVEELMKVNAGKADKGTVFEEMKNKLKTHFAQNEAFEKRKQEIAGIIQQNSAGLN
jgi:endonuclease III-like uncharacterized protein